MIISRIVLVILTVVMLYNMLMCLRTNIYKYELYAFVSFISILFTALVMACINSVVELTKAVRMLDPDYKAKVIAEIEAEKKRQEQYDQRQQKIDDEFQKKLMIRKNSSDSE